MVLKVFLMFLASYVNYSYCLDLYIKIMLRGLKAPFLSNPLYIDEGVVGMHLR
jgi:hypothetical protein